jgi:hypothetical protein
LPATLNKTLSKPAYVALRSFGPGPARIGNKNEKLLADSFRARWNAVEALGRPREKLEGIPVAEHARAWDKFDLYRLVVSDDSSLMAFMGKPIESDDEIVAILRNSAASRFDREVRGPRTRTFWSLREGEEDRSGHRLREDREKGYREVTED